MRKGDIVLQYIVQVYETFHGIRMQYYENEGLEAMEMFPIKEV